MKVHFPNSSFLGNMDGTFLKSFDPSAPEELWVSFNPKWTWAHPVVLCMTAALALSIEDATKIHSQQPDAKSRNYLERIGLMKALKLEPIPLNMHESAGRFIPLTQIKTSDELATFLEDVGLLFHTSQSVTDSIKYVLFELVTNVLEHAQSPIGAIVCAQYFEKSKKVSIGVVDTGMGIKKSITCSHPARTDMDAVQLALTPGITGAAKKIGGTDLNAGAGLFFIKSIAQSNRNFFVVYSGKAFYKLLKTQRDITALHANPFDDNHSRKDDVPCWNGTVVGVDVSTQMNRSFENLLEMIRVVYRHEKNKQVKERYKKARFI